MCRTLTTYSIEVCKLIYMMNNFRSVHKFELYYQANSKWLLKRMYLLGDLERLYIVISFLFDRKKAWMMQVGKDKLKGGF